MNKKIINISDGESDEYKKLIPNDKYKYLWNCIITSDQDRFIKKNSKFEIIYYSFFIDWTYVFNYPYDIVYRNKRYFHPNGTCIAVRFVPNLKKSILNKNTNNLFNKETNGIVRVGYSTALCTQDGLLGCAYKFFPIDETNSVNFLTQQVIDSDNEKYDISNIQSTNTVYAFKLNNEIRNPNWYKNILIKIKKKFQVYYSHYKSLEQSNGNVIYKNKDLYFKSKIAPTKVSELTKIKCKDKLLWEVYNEEWEHLGNILGNDNFVCSKFGNNNLWFHHNRKVGGSCPFKSNIFFIYNRIILIPLSIISAIIDHFKIFNKILNTYELKLILIASLLFFKFAFIAYIIN